MFNKEIVMRKWTHDVALLSLPVLLFVTAVSADEIVSTLDDQQEVAVTIYNEDLALVKDRRRVDLPAGASDLAFRDVSARIRPETALLRSLAGDGGLAVLEQNFDFDLLTPDKLLEKFVGRRVGVIKTHPTTGEETEEEAESSDVRQELERRLHGASPEAMRRALEALSKEGKGQD